MIRTLFFLTLLAAVACKGDDDVQPDCPNDVTWDKLEVGYFKDPDPTLLDNIRTAGDLQYEEVTAEAVSNGVEITLHDVRIRTPNQNYEIQAYRVSERRRGEECFQTQTEFSNDETSFTTDIASVLVLDMSASLAGTVNNLKEYAKNYAQTVVGSSLNSTVAVVFFSDRDAIQSTGFYTSSNIAQLLNQIDNYDDYQDRTALYQATQTGIELLENLDFDGQKSLVAFTDGGDNDSNNPSQLLQQIQAQTAIDIFAIGLRGNDFQESGLRDIVRSESNMTVADDASALQSIFESVSRGVVSVYTIRYIRSDQNLTREEAIDIRLSFDAIPIQ